MLKQITLVFATLAMSTVAFSQPSGETPYQIGFAANLNVGDSEVNISNDGLRNGFFNNNTTGNGTGNICANVFVFDPSEEEVACCACLVTPNALVSLSAKNSLIADVLTPAIPTSIVIKVVGSVPGTTGTAAAPMYTSCNPTLTISHNNPLGRAGSTTPNHLQFGLVMWGTTLEPAATAGTYAPVNVPFIQGDTGGLAGGGELDDLTSVCSFVQQEGTGFGVCKGCALGALSGTKQ